MRFLKFLQSREEGSVAAEYGLLIVGIAVAIGGAAALLGGRIADVYDGIF